MQQCVGVCLRACVCAIGIRAHCWAGGASSCATLPSAVGTWLSLQRWSPVIRCSAFTAHLVSQVSLKLPEFMQT